jgi:hypothetical protein
MTPTRHFTGSRTLPQGRSLGVNTNIPKLTPFYPLLTPFFGAVFAAPLFHQS